MPFVIFSFYKYATGVPFRRVQVKWVWDFEFLFYAAKRDFKLYSGTFKLLRAPQSLMLPILLIIEKRLFKFEVIVPPRIIQVVRSIRISICVGPISECG